MLRLFMWTERWLALLLGAALALIALFAQMQPVYAGGAEPAKTETGQPGVPMREDGRMHPIGSAAQYFSDLGRAGYGIYNHNCTRCHGHFAEGAGHAPSLIEAGYLDGYQARRNFHHRFTALTEAHGPLIRGTAEQESLGFNDLEIVGKYLRELGQWSRSVEKIEGTQSH